MTFVRKRTNKRGEISTSLIEAYRDDRGRPRQRVVTNLHGEETVEAAFAKCISRRSRSDDMLDEMEAGELPHTKAEYQNELSLYRSMNESIGKLEPLCRHLSDDELYELQLAYRERSLEALSKLIFAETGLKDIQRKVRRVLR